ncbi:uncharacterized protein LOC143884142 isoform X2 [Tasmannia lanceolata]|uniref:uncharacterized protein LOC143884142 isoform X2 n=1 Tax=Tasmannia lanceolata TaxID=3420 RepID=UPI0040628A95
MQCSNSDTVIYVGCGERGNEMAEGMDTPCDQRKKGKNIMWNGEMDKVLINTLLHQVSEGNKIPNGFKDIAYSAAVNEVNQHFGLHLTKDHIKNRVKTLKESFKCLNNIVGQSGFGWDSVTKRISVSEEVYENYIVAHPESKRFFTHRHELYEEMKEVFGECYATGQSTRTDMDTPDEQRRGKNIAWSSEMDRVLINTLLHQVSEGNKILNGFNDVAYNAAVNDVNQHFGLQLTKDHIKNRVTTLIESYKCLNNLVGQSGFGWDSVTKRISVSEEVYKTYIVAHPESKKYFTQRHELYEEMKEAFGEGYATGQWTRTNRDTPNDQRRGKNIVWSSEMDRVLINSLLHQVNEGNKIPNGFKDVAYNATLQEVNKHFGLRLTMDHIKNRVRTLKSSFMSVNNLMTQGGFGWDSVMKRISVSDEAYENYIAAHPESTRLFAQRHEFYEEMKDLFGEDYATRQWTRTTKDTSDDHTKRGKNTVWSSEMDKVLIITLLHQVSEGNKIPNGFKDVAYNAAVHKVNQQFELHLNKDHIKNRVKTLKATYKSLNDLVGQNGFGWDSVKKRISVSDEAYETYIAAHPESRRFFTQRHELYEEMKDVFGEYQWTRTNRDVRVRTQRDSGDGDSSSPCTPLTQNVGLELDDLGGNDKLVIPYEQSPMTEGSRGGTTSSPVVDGSKGGTSGRQGKRPHDAYLETMEKVANSISEMAAAINKRPHTTLDSSKLFAQVQEVDGFESDFLDSVFEYLSVHPEQARIFMAYDIERRKKYLNRYVASHGE